jgi:hypothetical protein
MIVYARYSFYYLNIHIRPMLVIMQAELRYFSLYFTAVFALPLH